MTMMSQLLSVIKVQCSDQFNFLFSHQQPKKCRINVQIQQGHLHLLWMVCMLSCSEPCPWVSTKQDDRGPKADLTITLHFCHWFPTSFNFHTESTPSSPPSPLALALPWTLLTHALGLPGVLSLMDLAVDPALWSSTQDRHRRLTLVTALAWDSLGSASMSHVKYNLP